MTVLVLVSGCVSPKNPVPASQGWTVMFNQDVRKLHQDIREDYHSYIQQLPARERNQLTESDMHFLRNANGQHAVSFDIGRPGFWGDVIWTHVLIYDANNKRIKVIKIKSRHTLS
jgi:hypothetical protein